MGGAHGTDGWRRLHPAALIVGMIGSFKSAIGVLLAVVGYRIVRDGWSPWMFVGAVALILALVVVPPVIEWLTTRYRLGADSLEFRTGLFSRTRRTIGYAAIHAIDGTAPVYFQPFGVVRLTITAAGSDANITLDAVPVALQLELESLRSASHDGHAADDGRCAAHADVAATGMGPNPGPALAAGSPLSPYPTAAHVVTAAAHAANVPSVANVTSIANVRIPSSADACGTIVDTSVDGMAPSTPVTTISADDIEPSSATRSAPQPATTTTAAAVPRAVSSIPPASATANRPAFRASVRDILLFAITDLGFLAAALAVYAAFDKVRDFIPRTWMRTATQSVDAIVAQGVLSVVLLALACVIVLMIVSIVSAMLRFYGFEVWRRGDDLVVVRGLFTRHTMTLPVRRIQTIVIRQSLLRRPFGLCSVSLGLSSSVDNDGDDANDGGNAANILPVVGMRRVTALLHVMLPEWDVRNDLPVRRTGHGLTRYYVTLPAALGVATAALAATVVIVQGWSGNWLLRMIPAVPFVIFAWWTASRWLRSQVDGYTLMDDAADGRTPRRMQVSDATNGKADRGTPRRMNAAGATDNVIDATSGSADAASDITMNTATDAANVGTGTPLPHRIMVTGASGLTRFTMVTRRSRVQSAIRKTAVWRASRSIETLLMPLFVTNDTDELRFQFIRRSDADHLTAWLES